MSPALKRPKERTSETIRPEDRVLAQAMYLKKLLSRRFVRFVTPRRFRLAALGVARDAERGVRGSATPILRAPAVGTKVMVRFSTASFEKAGLAPGSIGTVVDHAPSPVAPLERTVVVDWGDGRTPRTEDLFNLMYPPRSVATW